MFAYNSAKKYGSSEINSHKSNGSVFIMVNEVSPIIGESIPVPKSTRCL